MNEEIAALSSRARRAMSDQDWATVDAAATEILELAANAAEGHFLKGIVEKAARRPKRAATAFSQALALNPKRYDAAIELASQHSLARRNGEAAKLLEQYQGFLDNSPRYLDMAGTIYTEIGMAEKAMPLYELANRLQPGIDLFQANLAACSVYVGKIDQARNIYQKLIEVNPAHQRNHYHLSRLAKATDTKHISAMSDVLQSTNLSPDKNVFLYYAIGKEYEDLERWDDAFSYYKKAGDAVSSVANFDLSSDIALVDTIIERCTQAWLDDSTAADESHSDTHTPIFIAGLPRTGTTLTERILSSHSDIQSVGETQFLQMVMRRESGIQTIEAMNVDIFSAAAAVPAQTIGDGYLDSVRYRLNEKPFFIDKLPLNFLYLGVAAKALPNARLVYLKRHPMDACFSMYKQVFTWAYKFSYSLENLGNYYLAYDRLLQHWRNVLGERLVEVRYEDLVSDQEAQTRALLDRLGFEFDPACLDFEKNTNASATASSVQVRQKAHTRSIARWRHYEQHLQPLQRILTDGGVLDENGEPLDAG